MGNAPWNLINFERNDMHRSIDEMKTLGIVLSTGDSLEQPYWYQEEFHETPNHCDTFGEAVERANEFCRKFLPSYVVGDGEFEACLNGTKGRFKLAHPIPRVVREGELFLDGYDEGLVCETIITSPHPRWIVEKVNTGHAVVESHDLSHIVEINVNGYLVCHVILRHDESLEDLEDFLDKRLENFMSKYPMIGPDRKSLQYPSNNSVKEYLSEELSLAGHVVRMTTAVVSKMINWKRKE